MRLKQRKIVLQEQAEGIDPDKIKSQLLQSGGIASVCEKGAVLIIHYELGKYSYQQLKHELQQVITLKPKTTLGKCLDALIDYCETNELDHSQAVTGWDAYVRDFYLSLN